MSIRLLEVGPATSTEWDLTWQHCAYATFFHSRDWAELWETYTNGRIQPRPFLAHFSDGRKALIPLSADQTGKWARPTFLSSPAGTYGGWIARDDLSLDHVRLLAAHLTQTTGNLVWRLNPYDPLTARLSIESLSPDVTHVLRLTEGFEPIHARWTKGHRSAARKASREGVSVLVATKPAEWQSYYKVYEATLRRWGSKASSKYGWELFEAMLKRQLPSVRLWLACFQGQVISGALCLYAKTHVAYWHGASLEDHFHLRPVHLLMQAAIRNACDEGFRWFDFNPSGGHAGVAAFKRSFAAEELACPVLWLHRAPSKFRQLLRRVSGGRR